MTRTWIHAYGRVLALQLVGWNNTDTSWGTTTRVLVLSVFVDVISSLPSSHTGPPVNTTAWQEPSSGYPKVDNFLYSLLHLTERTWPLNAYNRAFFKNHINGVLNFRGEGPYLGQKKPHRKMVLNVSNFFLEEHPVLHKRPNSSKEGVKIFCFSLIIFHLLVRDRCCIWPLWSSIYLGSCKLIA